MTQALNEAFDAARDELAARFRADAAAGLADPAFRGGVFDDGVAHPTVKRLRDLATRCPAHAEHLREVADDIEMAAARYAETVTKANAADHLALCCAGFQAYAEAAITLPAVH